MEISAELLGGMAALLTAISALLTVVLVQARQASVAAKKAAHELKNDHGSSTKDAVDRTEESVQKLLTLVGSQGHQIGEIRRDLTGEREERQQDRELTLLALREHKEIWSAIRLMNDTKQENHDVQAR